VTSTVSEAAELDESVDEADSVEGLDRSGAAGRLTCDVYDALLPERKQDPEVESRMK
jgi:hypothetical protein